MADHTAHTARPSYRIRIAPDAMTDDTYGALVSGHRPTGGRHRAPSRRAARAAYRRHMARRWQALGYSTAGAAITWRLHTARRFTRRAALAILATFAGLVLLGTVATFTGAGTVTRPAAHVAPVVTVHAEADGGSATIGAWPVSQIRIVCGYAAGPWQVVQTVDGHAAGYALVSDRRCH